jgi:hypothetical protein
MEKIDYILRSIRGDMEAAFPGNIHVFFDKELDKWVFLVLDEKLYFKYRFSIVHQIDTKYNKYSRYFATGWDILREYQEYKTPILFRNGEGWESPDLLSNLDFNIKYTHQDDQSRWTEHGASTDFSLEGFAQAA